MNKDIERQDKVGIPERGRTQYTVNVPYGITIEDLVDDWDYSEEDAAILIMGNKHDMECQCEICQKWWALAPDDWFEV